jgi:MarR family transcriptional regulator, organic hydroperoxide resistance regulator
MKMTDQLAYLIASVNKQLEDELHEGLRAEGVPVEQLRILEMLADAGALAMGSLAAGALLEPTTLTKIIDRMVADGLVVRALDPNDRRRVLIALTPAGESVHQRLRRISTSQEARIKKRLPRAKLVELRSLLRGLTGA